MNIVLITTGHRPEILSQSLRSLVDNAVDVNAHTLTVVIDDPCYSSCVPLHDAPGRPTLILNAKSQGASASRNIGASSIPKYRRQKYVMFLDDDVYMCPKWDETLIALIKRLPECIVSGHAHPYNGSETRFKGLMDGATYLEAIPFQQPLVISTVHMLMGWSLWDDVGFFCEPGGPGGSEDVDYCRRAKEKGYGFAVTEPQCVIHTGLTSSSGKQIVGYEEMVRQNYKLIERYGLTGRVFFK